MSEAIDWGHLEQQTFGERDIAKDVLRLFVAQMKDELAALTPEAPNLADRIHKLKGSARGIGAWQVAQCAEVFATMEEQTERQVELDVLKHAMEAALQAAEQKLRSWDGNGDIRA